MCSCGLVGVYCAASEGAMLLLTALGGGVTHITISPDGNLLFVGFRMVCIYSVMDSISQCSLLKE